MQLDSRQGQSLQLPWSHLLLWAASQRQPGAFKFVLWSSCRQCCGVQFGLVHVSVGDLLRAEVAAGTEAGVQAQQFMDQGFLVPNEVVVDMVKHRLQQDDVQEHGWLLDGYPRSGEQAEAIEQANIRPDVFLLIEVSSKHGQ